MSRPTPKPVVTSGPAGSMRPVQKGALALLALIQFVCPLLFFTNLTRNPYFTQIALIYILVACVMVLWSVAALKTGEWVRPQLGFEKSLGLFLAVGFVTLVLSWIQHPGLRPGILFEGIRVWLFTLVNSVFAVYLPIFFIKPLAAETDRVSIWPDLFFAVFWSLLWFGFSSMKNPDPNATMWDPYGLIVWSAGVAYVLYRTRKGDARSFFHVVFIVAVVAGLYGLMQYAGRDLIWANLVIPYGGRPVSSFGNPNFLSSYLLLVCPLATAFALSSKGADRWGYGAVAVITTVSILCTLTRSTYVGLLASFFIFAVLYYKPEHRPVVLKLLVAAAVVVGLVLIFPGTPVSKIQSPLARFTEIFDAMKSGESYGPWHQRILIWSSAWDMVKERPFFGKGWGCFELFYPFYQGAYLFNPVFAQWRTHANNAHNILMEIWSQVGTLGVGLSLLLFVSLVAGAVRVVKQKTSGMSQMIAVGLLAGWLGMVVDNFFGNVSIFFAMPAFLFWWNMGSLYNEAAAIKTTVRPAASPFAKSLLIGFAVFNVFAGFYYAARWAQEVYYFEGFKFSKTNRIPESIKSLEKAYAWFPGEVNSNYELGNSYARQAKTLADNQALEESKKLIRKGMWAYGEAIKANPGYDEIYYNLGVTQFQIGEEDKGLRNLRTAVMINPLLQGAYSSLVSRYATLKNWEAVRDLLEQAVQAFPRDRDFWNNLGYVYSQMGQDQKSYEATKRAVELDPTYKAAWQNFTTITNKLNKNDPLLDLPGLLVTLERLVNEKNFQEAKPVAKRLSELLPSNLDVGLSYANILYYVGDVTASVEQYQRLNKLDRTFGPAHSNLGRVYLAQEKFSEARRHLTLAIEINPNDQEAKQAFESLPKR